jgi:predicted TIM-barrel fold metal-dependent hydrolase
MNGIVDFHTHAFPDKLAERAIPLLEEGAHCKATLDGRVASLLASMDRAGIARSVVLSIATKPEQFEPILRWSLSIASDRLVPFASLHPADPQAAARVDQIKAAGLKGLKLHPYYQEFALDEERLMPVFERVEATGLILVCHTGFDIAYERYRCCDPVRIARVVERFPRMKLVTSHLGAWEDWGEVRRHLLGKPIFVELSYSLDFMSAAEARELLMGHPAEYLLFGSDSPWADQTAALAALRALRLPPEREERLLTANAASLLGAV